MDRLTSHQRHLGRHSIIKWLTTPSNNSQVWAGWAAPSHSLRLDRKPLGAGDRGGHHHTHPLKQRMVVKYGEVERLKFHNAHL